MIEPSAVVLAGDWHGDAGWAKRVARALPALLPDQPRLVIQLGDFGIWPGRGGRDYLSDVDYWMKRADAQVWFLHGNHDDHDQLDALWTGPQLTPIRERVSWLPVDTRWTWHGRQWVAVGGAASVDRAFRLRHGLPWWKGEYLTREEAETVMASGPAQVLLTHDAPASVPLVMGPPCPSWEAGDLARSQAQRELLQEVMEEVRPELVVHGHHHQWQYSLARIQSGAVPALSLDMQQSAGNLVLLDTRTLDWVPVSTAA